MYNFRPKPIWIWNEHRNTKQRMSGKSTYEEHLLYNENERNATCKHFMDPRHPRENFMDPPSFFYQRQNLMNLHHSCHPHHPRTYAAILPTPPRYPHHSRYLADSNSERNRVFKSQLSRWKKYSLNQDSALTMMNCIELHEGFLRNC